MTPTSHGPADVLVARVLLALAALLVGGAVIMAATEGVLDGVLFALLVAVPTLAVGLLLRGRRHPLTTRFAALLVGAIYVMIVAGNWTGYDTRTRVILPLLFAPIVLGCLAALLVATSREVRPPRAH